MIIDFFGAKGMGQLGGINRQSRVMETGQTDKAAFQDISTDEQSVSSSPEKVAETDRAAMVEEIKAQVEAGTYQPDLDKVAGSLLKFIVEGRRS